MLEKDGNSEVHVEKLEQRPTGSIAFGLERLGLIAVQAPIVSCIVLAALIVGAIFGIDTGNTKRKPSVSPRRNSTSWSWSKARRCLRAKISKECVNSLRTCNWWRAPAA